MVSVSLDLIQLGIGFAFIFIEFLIIMWLGIFWYDIKTKMPDIYARQYAKKKKQPLINLFLGSGRILTGTADKDKKYDLKFKQKDDVGFLVDPALLSKHPHDHYTDGTPVYNYGIDFHFPIDSLGVRGIISLIRNIRKKYTELDRIRDDFVFMELLSKEGEDLVKDCEFVLDRYEAETKEDILTSQELASTIEEIKTNLKRWNVEPGFFTIKQALDRLPFGTFAKDIEAIEEITESNARSELDNRMREIWTYVTISGVIIGFMVVAYLVISAYKGG